MDKAYITVLTTENYIPGVKALKRSLKKTKTKYNLFVLIPHNSLFKGKLYKEKIIDKFCKLIEHDNVPLDLSKVAAQKKKRWFHTFFKLAATDLVQFKKIVLLDSDMLVVRNIDSLFDKPHYSAVAAGEHCHKDYHFLNSGLIVLEPSHQLYNKIIDCATQIIAKNLPLNLNLGDQDIFQAAYPTWPSVKCLKLPENFNCFFNDLSILVDKYNFNYKQIYIIHFIGDNKPWMKLFSKYNFKILFNLFKKLEIKRLKFFLKYILYAVL